MLRRTLDVCLLVLASFALSGMSYDTAKTGRIPSPQGKFEIAFEPAADYVALDPDKPSPVQGLKNVSYQIAFYPPGRRTAIATSHFYDIYTSSPTSPQELAKAILWSPQEDIAILPGEQWPKKSDSKAATNGIRKAISLNTDIPWQTTPLPLDDNSLVWIDRFTVAGNWTDGCRLTVAEFDGRTGKTAAITEAPLPFGYKIISSSGTRVLMKKVPGPCATPEQAGKLVSECLSLDLKFMRREIAPCP